MLLAIEIDIVKVTLQLPEVKEQKLHACREKWQMETDIHTKGFGVIHCYTAIDL